MIAPISACDSGSDRFDDGSGDGDVDGDSDGDNGLLGYYTEGRNIMTPDGQVAKFNGMNWYGFDDPTMCVHGLDRRPLDEYLDILQQNGYNLIRLPYSNEMLTAEVAPRAPAYEKQNPDLVGLTPFEQFDYVINKMGERGIKIILDRHRPTSAEQSALWYTDEVPEEQWINDWVALANYFKGNSAIIGADLHNEPRDPASWAWDFPDRDWNKAAERCGNRILEANSDWLIIVEGVGANAASYPGGYWWGGNLRGVRDVPVVLNVPNKLVYSTHDYGPEIQSTQPWFQDPDFPNNLSSVFEDFWGFIATNDIAPVLVGEFGAKDVSPDSASGKWIRALIDYIKANGIYWTYWTFTPDSMDTEGLLRVDWKDIKPEKQDLLQQLY